MYLTLKTNNGDDIILNIHKIVTATPMNETITIVYMESQPVNILLDISFDEFKNMLNEELIRSQLRYMCNDYYPDSKQDIPFKITID